MHELFIVCTEQVRSTYVEHSANGLPKPTQLEGEVQFDQALKMLTTTDDGQWTTEVCLYYKLTNESSAQLS